MKPYRKYPPDPPPGLLLVGVALCLLALILFAQLFL